MAARRDRRYPIRGRGGEIAPGCFVPISVVLLGVGAYFRRSPALALAALGVAMLGLLAVRLRARRDADIERMFLRDHDGELRGIVE